MKTTSYVAVVSVFMKNDMDVSENSGTLKSSILIGFSITFTIHFGGPPLFWGHTHIMHPFHGAVMLPPRNRCHWKSSRHRGSGNWNFPESLIWICAARHFFGGFVFFKHKSTEIDFKMTPPWRFNIPKNYHPERKGSSFLAIMFERQTRC